MYLVSADIIYRCAAMTSLKIFVTTDTSPMCSESSGNIPLTQVDQLLFCHACRSCRKALLKIKRKKKISDSMCADGLSSSTYPGARPSTHPGVTDPESRSCTNPGLLAGVAVIVTVLVTAAACIVVLVILWRYDTSLYGEDDWPNMEDSWLNTCTG